MLILKGTQTTGVGYDLKELKATIYECLVDGLEPKEAILKTDIENLVFCCLPI